MSKYDDWKKLFKERLHERVMILYIRNMIGENFPYFNKKIKEIYNVEGEIIKYKTSPNQKKRRYKADLKVVLEDDTEAYIEVVHKNEVSKSKKEFYVTNKINSFILKIPYESIFEDVTDEKLLQDIKSFGNYAIIGEEGAFKIQLEDQSYMIKDYSDCIDSVKVFINNETYYILKEKNNEEAKELYKNFGKVYAFKRYNKRASFAENIAAKNFKAVKC